MHFIAIVLTTIISNTLTLPNNGINPLLSFPAPTLSLHSPSPSIEKSDKFNQRNNNYRIKTVVIDAGHGGKDPGCSGTSTLEKNIALSISKKLAAVMRAKYPDIRFILTRDKDVFIPLYKRADIANKNDADLFISIHCNATASRSTTAVGTETYVMGLHTAQYNLDVAKRENASILWEDNYQENYDYDPNSPEGHIMLNMFQNAFLEQSILFAEHVENNFRAVARRKSRGVKQAGFVVLKSTTMPSVLIETGFLNNPTEEQYLYTAEGQNKIAQSILTAFETYKRTVEEENFQLSDGQRSPQPLAYSAPKPVKNNTYSAPKKVSPPPPKKDPVPLYRPGSRTRPAGSERTIDFRRDNPMKRSQPVVTEKKAPIPKSSSGGSQIQFKVQIAASPSPINTSLAKWRSLEYSIEMIKEDNQYKYQARNFQSFDQADRAKTKLQLTGFPDAFIVAYKAGQRIPLPVAKSELGLY